MFYRLFLLTFFTGFIEAKIVAQSEVKSLHFQVQSLPIGEIRATGWLKEAIGKNLMGFTGNLDKLVPDLIVDDDIYARNRLTPNMKSKSLGAISDGGDWQVQFLWWNSETQGNWLDGLLRSAIVNQDQNAIHKASSFVKHILASQDSSGYIGIYNSDLRYRFNNENGELWSKTTILRFLLAWYAYQKDSTVLKAVERAVHEVMQSWPKYKSTPFYSTNPNVSGLSHGLMFTDILTDLYILTGNQEYLNYGVFLYEDFSKHKINEDAQLSKLLNDSLPLLGHGVHTYEHIRSVALATYVTKRPELSNALEKFINKVKSCLTPSGAPVGDEFIGGRKGDAWKTGYEYCSLHELMHSWIYLFQLNGNATHAKAAEKLFFNAALGSLHPTSSAICYLKTDDSFVLNGGKHGDTTDPHQTRYRYSPVHKEAAVCCVPNAGRIFPYYVQNMWMKDSTGLVATLLGPSDLKTTFQGQPVQILANTSYPFDSVINFQIKLLNPISFQLKIRKPEGLRDFHVSVPYLEDNEYIIISKKWKLQDEVQVTFSMPPKIVSHSENGGVYIQAGPLVFCKSISAKETITRTFGLPEFKELTYKAINLEQPQYKLSDVIEFETKSYPTYRIKSWNSYKTSWESIDLVPMAGSILRQVTFEKIMNK
ncbi:MAG: glycoside hydrolase family 127 protein [Hydrotalea sp.]|nr:glycoside hydrolase family 127 protein [Hydrotalea sp.]